ncbi:MAG: glutathione S-transferase C-terminal domain-containing protein, partial [Pseudomonadota bacterium]
MTREALGIACDPAVRKDLTRIFQLWSEARSDFARDGPFLFGDFSIADAMYAPVVSRIRTYGPVQLFNPLSDYTDAVWQH